MQLITVRTAIAADAAAIEKLYSELVSSPHVRVLPARLAAIARDPMTRLLVAETEYGVVGTVLVSLCSDVMFQNQPFAVVENLVVSASARSTGIGTRLMLEVEHLCQAADCSKIMLLSSSTRSDAHRFFEKTGYAGTTKKGFIKYRKQFAHKG